MKPEETCDEINWRQAVVADLQMLRNKNRELRVVVFGLGPWESYDNFIKMPGVGLVDLNTGNPMIGDSSNDTEFIAAANPTVILEMIAHARLQEERIERLREALGKNRFGGPDSEVRQLLNDQADTAIRALRADDELAKGEK